MRPSYLLSTARPEEYRHYKTHTLAVLFAGAASSGLYLAGQDFNPSFTTGTTGFITMAFALASGAVAAQVPRLMHLVRPVTDEHRARQKAAAWRMGAAAGALLGGAIAFESLPAVSRIYAEDDHFRYEHFTPAPSQNIPGQDHKPQYFVAAPPPRPETP